MLKITNTLTKQREELVPREKNKINMFVCGPTTYDYIHAGNARTFVFFDVVAKYLRYAGYTVNYIQNITDIDDKIIQRATEHGRDPLEWAREYEEIFKADMKMLGVDAVNNYARATDHIGQVIKQVETLINKGNAYLIEDDGYYFSLDSFSNYGKLSGRTAQMTDDAVSRIDESERKRNPGDFALWKFPLAKNTSPPENFGNANIPTQINGEPVWWGGNLGWGRPGWHIEDTAITEHYFGPQYDLHGGGQDLMFPHHEAEIAQQESASGLKPFVKYWIHVAFLINKEIKMSKSAGNFSTARQLLYDYPKEVLRFYLLSAHYKTPLDFSPDIINQSRAGTNRISEFRAKLAIINNESGDSFEHILENAKNKFESTMNDDFGTSSAIASVFDLINKVNPLLASRSISKAGATNIYKFLDIINSVLGIIPAKEEELPKELQKLVDEREKCRSDKNWERADKIRAQIKEMGYKIEDTIYGPLLLEKTKD